MLASQKKKKEDGEHVLWCLSRVRYCFIIPIDRYWACPLTPFSGRHSGRGTHKDPEFWTGSCRILLMRDSFQIVYFFKLGSMAISNYRNSAWIHWPRNPETLKYNLHIEYGFFFLWRLFRIIEAITVWTIFVTEKNWPPRKFTCQMLGKQLSIANTAWMTHVSLEFSYDIFDVVVPNRF